MQTRRQFIGSLAIGALCAVLSNAFGSIPYDAGVSAPDHRLSGPESTYFRALEMVGRVTASDAVVNMVSAENLSATVQARVRWAETSVGLPTSPNVSAIVSTSDTSATLELAITGLQANRKYYYLVQYETTDAPGVWMDMPEIGEFYSQRTAGQSFSFCVLADPHWATLHPGSPHEWTAQQALQRILEHGGFDFCIDLGDSACPNSMDSAEEGLSFYAEYRAYMAGITRKMPTFVVLGNHEREAGFFQRGAGLQRMPNGLGPTDYHQRWATEARLRFVPNPQGDTYPEGGEGAPGYDTADEWAPDYDPGDPQAWYDPTHITSDLQNFYAWTWGDALFIVLDPHRYTKVGLTRVPTDPSDWTLGPTQMIWLQNVLAASAARWKFVLSHHQVGGFVKSGFGKAYGRGSAVEARDPEREQYAVQQLMEQHGVQFFVYGHDHAFCDSVERGVHYLQCGRPTNVSSWYTTTPEMRDSYGDLLIQGQDKEWIRALYNVVGYTQFHVTPDSVTMKWIRTGYSFTSDPLPIEEAQRDWLECWVGRAHAVASPSSVNVAMAPTDVDGVYTVAGAQLSDCSEPPAGEDYYMQPYPIRPEEYADTEVPIDTFPESVAVVDSVPELMYERTWLYRGDADDDGDRDLADYAAVQECYSPGAGSVPPTEPCAMMDQDGDEDVDLEDLAGFVQGFTGPLS
ncbi:MAG: hypothetical protein GY842_15415 [bacterium]|nr:hypothetical protein [bacterium]